MHCRYARHSSQITVHSFDCLHATDVICAAMSTQRLAASESTVLQLATAPAGKQLHKMQREHAYGIHCRLQPMSALPADGQTD
jgi:hypothetical protein